MNFTEAGKPFVSVQFEKQKGLVSQHFYPEMLPGFLYFDMLILLVTWDSDHTLEKLILWCSYCRLSSTHLESTHLFAPVPCQKWQSETTSSAPKVSSALFSAVPWAQQSLKQIPVTVRSTTDGDSAFSQGWSTPCSRQPTSKVFKCTAMALSSEQDTTAQHARSLIQVGRELLNNYFSWTMRLILQTSNLHLAKIIPLGILQSYKHRNKLLHIWGRNSIIWNLKISLTHTQIHIIL